MKIVTIGDLPARFDWSIMGCTILLLALMNLQKVKEKGGPGWSNKKGGTGKRTGRGKRQKHRNTVRALLKTRLVRNAD